MLNFLFLPVKSRMGGEKKQTDSFNRPAYGVALFAVRRRYPLYFR